MEEENEIIILINGKFLSENSDIIHGFAKQMSNGLNTVRLLTYESSSWPTNFENDVRMLQIDDKKIKAFSNVDNDEAPCQYNVTADNLMKSLNFSHTSKRGFILFEIDKDAREIANYLFLENNVPIIYKTHMYRILKTSKRQTDSQRKYDTVTDISVPEWRVLKNIGASYFPELCKGMFYDHIERIQICNYIT